MQDVSGMFHKREIGVRNDTYTRAEIDAKDGTIQVAADKAQETADSAVSVNNTQNTQIAALQKSAHSHSNKDVLDKTEQPYTTAERDKLAGLENYTHQTYTAHTKGFYKFANDDKGHIEDAVPVTKEDITDLGIPGKNTTYTFSSKGTTLKIVDNCQKQYSVDFPSSRTITSIVPYFPNTYDEGRGFCWCQFGIGFTSISPIGYKDVGIDGHPTKIYSCPPGIAKLAIALSGVSHHRVSITADLPLHNISGVEKRPLENLKIFSNTPENEIFVYAWALYAGSEYDSGYNTNQYSFRIFIYTKEKDLTTAPTPQITVETTVYGENCTCTVSGSDASNFSDECRLQATKMESITEEISQKANKSDVPEKVSELENDAGYGTYTKPAAGIPKSDLASGVQASLGKADTALQKHQDISGKLDKTGDASNTTVAFSAASARENVKTGEKLSVIVGKIAKWFADLKVVAFTGSYNDLSNKPTIPDISGKQDKLTAGTNITISGNTISAKDTTYGNASASVAGLMSAEDKTSLDSMSLLHLNVGGSTNFVGVKFKVNRVSARFMVMENNGERADIYISIRIGVDTKAKVYVSGNTNSEYKVFYDNLDYVYVIFNCQLWSYIVCTSTVRIENMIEWRGTSYPTGLTGISMDIQILLDTGNYINYALAKDGTAVAAAKLSTARKINTIAFDGTADIVIPRSTKCMNASSGTGGQTGYVKVATFTVKSQYTNMPTVVRYRNRNTMPVELIFRFKNQSRVDPELEFILQVVELTNYGYKEAYLYKSAASTWDLIIAKSEAWDSVQILDCQQADGVSVTFENTHVSTVPSTAIRATEYTRAMVTSTVAAAKTLTDSGWTAMTVEGYAKSGTVKYRTYGKQITITGSVVLKNDIATSYPAPQNIASTSFDFSKIVGCSGVGRSSSGVGVYVKVENYNGDNLVCVYALGSKIAAGSTLYFTITGFID